MTKLSSGDGIRCDLCHAVHTTKFQYFSYDMIDCHVSNGMAPTTLHADRRYPSTSIDVCNKCHQSVAAKVISANIKLQSAQRRGKADCELSGNPIPDGPAVIVFVTSVEVDLKTQHVNTDANCLSFLIGDDVRSQLEAKPTPAHSDSWNTKS